MRRYLPLLLVMTLGGCTTVRVPEPFGDTPVALDPDEWNGTWCDPDVLEAVPGTNTMTFDPSRCVSATVADPVQGVLDVVIPDDPQPRRCRVHLRQIGENSAWMFLTIEGQGHFEFVQRLTRTRNHVFTWDLSGGIRKEIELGRLPGRVVDGETYLEPLTHAAILRIVADEQAEFFDRAAPDVFVHVDEVQTVNR